MASASNEGVERREVHFAGRVQGVGFRYTARGLAQRYGLVAEGTTTNWDRLMATLAEDMDRFIHSTDVQIKPATGEFEQFEIRR
jgi:acylphosphatase